MPFWLDSPHYAYCVFYAAFFQADSPIYSAKYVRFHLGHRAYADDSEEDDTVLEDPQCAAKNFVWTYTSQLFPMVQVSSILEWTFNTAYVYCFETYFLLISLDLNNKKDTVMYLICHTLKHLWLFCARV